MNGRISEASVNATKLMYKNQYEFWRDSIHQAVQVTRNEGPTDTSRHFHNSLELMYVYKGTIYLTIEEEKYDLTEGQLAIIPGFSMHSLTIGEDSFRWLVIIPRHMMGSVAYILDNQTFAQRIVTDDDEKTLLHQILGLYQAVHFKGIYRCQRGKPDHWRNTVSLLSAALVGTLIDMTGLCEVSRSASLITEALKYIHVHFREVIRIPGIARQLLCSQQQLSNQFVDTLGMTPTSYINRIRAIDVKYNLSENPTMTLEQAAELSGFGSVRSMLRAYRSEFGCTPTENRGDL